MAGFPLSKREGGGDMGMINALIGVTAICFILAIIAFFWGRRR